ncbi:hypothetical protein BGZ54_007449 [Gamsiella multidivaricata]|nr:hypothetical protein BGZ54_007449 [Gamsiella multidivaricata]
MLIASIGATIECRPSLFEDLVIQDHGQTVLGPFPTGMREQDFGADPLEAFGGFRNLPYDKDAKYPSELAKDGIVRWHTTEIDSEGWINVLYPEIDWKFNQQFMGWAFNQFQAWARSSFIVPSIASCFPPNEDGKCSVTIQCENVGDFYVDSERLSGDWYGYGLTRHTLRLAPNTRHTISVRVIHEVRIFGGAVLPPPSKFRCELKVAPRTTQHDHGIMVQVAKEGYGGYVVMDAVDNALAGEYISVALRNVGPERVLVRSVKVEHGSNQFSAELKEQLRSISLYPGTHRPVTIRLSLQEGQRIQGLEFSLRFELAIMRSGNNMEKSTGALETDLIRIEQKEWGKVYKYTFLDFDGTVHYAAAIPPSKPSSQPLDSAPVIVALHGADRVTNRTLALVRGYDWHGASVKNAMNAIHSLADKLPGVPDAVKNIPGIKPDPERLFMAGHSNGGQGAWFLVTHFPDKAIAATPAAGYVNIKQYVPFLGWLSNSHTDSYLRGLLESSIIEFDNDVHMSNAVGIPTLARTGSADNNVPPFNSRKMVRLGQENSHNFSSISLSEISGGGHWFTNILHDGTMQGFLKQHLHDDVVSKSEGAVEDQYDKKAVVHLPFSKSFKITVINPAGMGSKGGIQVEQLQIPFRKGTIKVSILGDEQTERSKGASTIWVLQTTNIRRFSFADSPSLEARRGSISTIVIDGMTFNLQKDAPLSSSTFIRERTSKKGDRWQFDDSNEWTATERHPETYGPAIQVLEKRVVIVIGTTHLVSPELLSTADRIAKLVAHDIFLYGRGDVEIYTDEEYLATIGDIEHSKEERPNLVLIGDSHQNTITNHILIQSEQEVTIDSQSGVVSILPKSEIASSNEFREPGTGLLMIRPWGSSNLAMVIAGLDVQGLETAARLFPKRTGLLVPDWGKANKHYPF